MLEKKYIVLISISGAALVLICVALLYSFFSFRNATVDGMTLSGVQLATDIAGNTVVVGTVFNTTDEVKSSVRVQIDLFDEADEIIGATYAVKDILYAREAWNFEAQVFAAEVVRVRATLQTEAGATGEALIPVCASGACE